jgi:hypothetical protein
MRVVDTCSCGRHHRNSQHFARCAWPGSEVTGRGQVALVLACDPLRVVLSERLSWAHVLRAEYATFGCGPTCQGEHELLAIDHDGPREAA